MGSSNISITVKGNEDAVRKAYKKKQADDLYEYGHDYYNGSFTTLGAGVRLVSTVLNSQAEAHDFIDGHHQKGDDALAVRFKIYKPNKSMENLQRQIFELEQLRWRGQSERKRASTDKKLAEKQAKLADWRRKKAAKVKRTMWLVGGWCCS